MRVVAILGYLSTAACYSGILPRPHLNYRISWASSARKPLILIIILKSAGNVARHASSSGLPLLKQRTLGFSLDEDHQISTMLLVMIKNAYLF